MSWEIEERLNRVRSPFRVADVFGVEEIIGPARHAPLLCEFANLAARLREAGPVSTAMRPLTEPARNSQIRAAVGFWPWLVIAPLLVGILGTLVERYGLRKAHRFGPVAELLFTFGLSFLAVEAVQLIWGKAAVDYRIPPSLQGALFTFHGTSYPIYKAFMMAVSLGMLLALFAC